MSYEEILCVVAYCHKGSIAYFRDYYDAVLKDKPDFAIWHACAKVFIKDISQSPLHADSLIELARPEYRDQVIAAITELSIRGL